MAIKRRTKLMHYRWILLVLVVSTFLIFECRPNINHNEEKEILLHPTEEEIPPNYIAKFVPNHLNKTYTIGILILCNYKENKEALPSIISKLSDQCIPSIYRTMEGVYKYKIYIGVTKSIQKHLASKYSEFSIIALDNEIFSDGINSLAWDAYSDQIEYFVVSTYKTVFKLNFWTSQAIYALKSHCPSDLGVVLQYCCKVSTTAIVHRRHITMSGNMFPPKLNLEEAITWLHGNYFSDFFSEIPIKTELYYFNMTKRKAPHLDKSLKSRLKMETSLCVISYSLYGSSPRYTIGTLENVYLSSKIYPGWNVWIYHDNTVPKSILNDVCNQNNIKCIDMSSSIIKNRRSWRFLVASEQNISRYIIRDIDSRLSVREKLAVSEWIISGKKLHTMRDHPNQAYFINAGMWGGISDTYPNMEFALLKSNYKEDYTIDSEFLTKEVWPFANVSVMQHDSVLCFKFGGIPFPTSRIGYEHVGSVYIDGVMRKGDVDAFKKFKIPDKCNTR